MKQRTTHKWSAARSAKPVFARTGFTLVEMLVSVALVLLMMTMFTSIFQMATESVSVQRGIAQNNQKARAFITVLRSDMAKRTMRYALPYSPNESSATSPSPFGDRGGYIYISVNDPDSWQDDLLQFTVDARQLEESTDDTHYFGTARLLYDLAADPMFAGTPRRTSLRSNPNQPDADDGRMSPNEVGASPAAEVSYFVRNGNLYRRVMLLRQPLAVAGLELATQPESSVGNNSYQLTLPPPGGVSVGGVMAVVASPQNINHVNPNAAEHYALAGGDSAPVAWNTVATNDFWAHFDYAAKPVFVPTGGSNPPLPGSAAFVGIESLDNSLGASISIGNPANRFGFNPLTGFSREHDNVTSTGRFIGRFTQAETSHPDFNYPMAACRTASANNLPVSTAGAGALGSLNSGTVIGNGNPMDVAGTPLVLNPVNGVITQFAGTSGRGGFRRVEDVLLTNVHGMRIEVWDERLQDFVVPGHSKLRQFRHAGGGLTSIMGDYHVSRRLNGAHGPLGTAAPALNHVFDTWHPAARFNYNGSSSSGVPTFSNNEMSPPFIPYRYYPPREGDAPVTAGGSYSGPAGPGPSSNTMPNPLAEYDPETGRPGENKGYWVGSDFSDPDPANWTYHSYNVGDVVFARPTFDGDPGGEIFEWDDDILPPTGFQIAFRCVRAGYAADPNHAAGYPTRGQPAWPRVAGQRTTEAAIPGASGQPAVWESFDNRRPLKSIRVTVQFYDQSTQKLRQLRVILPVTTDR